MVRDAPDEYTETRITIPSILYILLYAMTLGNGTGLRICKFICSKDSLGVWSTVFKQSGANQLATPMYKATTHNHRFWR